jgi:hypothetical protein
MTKEFFASIISTTFLIAVVHGWAWLINADPDTVVSWLCLGILGHLMGKNMVSE